tara:strand:- start:1498 stop:1770 length:273 start_codon:yes stop_codon:yes gene_type:complete
MFAAAAHWPCCFDVLSVRENGHEVFLKAPEIPGTFFVARRFKKVFFGGRVFLARGSYYQTVTKTKQLWQMRLFHSFSSDSRLSLASIFTE